MTAYLLERLVLIADTARLECGPNRIMLSMCEHLERMHEELDVRVMETRVRVLGEEHPSTLTSMANLASTFWNQGR